GNEKPAGLAGIGNLLERPFESPRQMTRPIGRGPIDEKHAGNADRERQENGDDGAFGHRRRWRPARPRQNAAPLSEVADQIEPERGSPLRRHREYARAFCRRRRLRKPVHRTGGATAAPVGSNVVIVTLWPFEMLNPLMVGPAR